MHIPPKHKHLIRYYGLYSSRTRGKANKDGSLAQFGYKPIAAEDVKHEQSPESSTEMASNKASRQSWARLIQKVYEVDPMVCPKCSHALKVIAVITEPHEARKILNSFSFSSTNIQRFNINQSIFLHYIFPI